MISYEIVTVSFYRTARAWTLMVSWRSSVDDRAPEWHSLRVPDCQLEDGSLQDLLEALGEEVFNQAEYAEQAAKSRDRLPAPSGDSESRPMF